MPSLARSVPKPLKVPSLARYVPKPCVGEVGGPQMRHCDEMMSKFWVFDFYETFICYREYLRLNCYIGKKVQKIFLIGLKIW